MFKYFKKSYKKDQLNKSIVYGRMSKNMLMI